jgi:cupin fold WbuC family metalloprotein
MIKIFNKILFDNLSAKAKTSERRRTHLTIHELAESNVQKFFVATEPDTYMRPHQHPQSHKWELFTLLRGKIDLLTFDNNGNLQTRVAMSDDSTQVVEVPAATWHCYVCMAPGTIGLEIKEGAYIPTAADDFAPWSPAEGTPEAAEYLAQLRTAQPG